MGWFMSVHAQRLTEEHVYRPFHAVTGIMTCRLLIHLRKALVEKPTSTWPSDSKTPAVTERTIQFDQAQSLSTRGEDERSNSDMEMATVGIKGLSVTERLLEENPANSSKSGVIDSSR
jgi:hypothetical protein